MNKAVAACDRLRSLGFARDDSRGTRDDILGGSHRIAIGVQYDGVRERPLGMEVAAPVPWIPAYAGTTL